MSKNKTSSSSLKKSTSRGLGKGVDVLFFNDDKPVESNKIVDLALTSIIPSRFQARKTFTKESIVELSQSIIQNGVIQPVLVRRNPNKNNYELIAGERRWRASKLAGITNIPAIIKNPTDQDMILIGLVENLQRENLNCIDEAEGISELVNNYKLTHDKASQLLNKSRSVITNALRLLELDNEVKDLIRAGKIDMGHARALLSIEKNQQKLIANEIINNNLTVRKIEDIVKTKKTEKPKTLSKNKKDISEQNHEISYLINEIEEKIGLKVVCNFNKNSSGKAVENGDIKIHFSSIEQFNHIVSLLKQ